MKNHFHTNYELRETVLAALALAAVMAAPTQAWAAPFQSGGFVAYRVGGDGEAKSVHLDEFGVDGKLRQNVPLSSETGDSLVASDTASEGLLSRSRNGKCLTVPGYAAPSVYDKNPKKQASSSVPRAVLFVDVNAAPGGLTRLGEKAFSKDSIRGAVSDDCARVWTSGAGDKKSADYQGVWYAEKGAATSLQLDSENSQGIAIDAEELLVSIAGGGSLNSYGPTLPVSGSPVRVEQAGVGHHNFRGITLVRLNPQSVQSDTLYVAANDANAIQKYIRKGAGWESKGSIELTKTHGLVVLPTGSGNALLFATDGQKLYRLFDSSGPDGELSGTPVEMETGGPGGSYYGLALTPEETLPTHAPFMLPGVTVSKDGAALTAHWLAADATTDFYIVETSRDNFATVEQSFVATGNSVPLTGLASGKHKVRVRAVNGFGGSGNALSQEFDGGEAPVKPTISLPPESAFSGVQNDVNDLLATEGLPFTASDVPNGNGAPLVTPVSANTNVATAKVSKIGTDAYLLKITPVGVGYSDITVTVTGSNDATTTATIRYAASANTARTAGTRWYAGRSDGSTAIVLSDRTMLVADDEAPDQDNAGNAPPGGNALFSYDRNSGGLPVGHIKADAALNLKNPAQCTSSAFTGLANCKADGEVDLESSFVVGNSMYFTGSHSNNKNGRSRPDRWRFFAVDAGSKQVTGYYQWLREDLRVWDSNNVHGRGANHLGIVSSSDGGNEVPEKAPETDTLSGFSIEGTTTNQDDTQLWLGFRAPLVGASEDFPIEADKPDNRTHALIIPVKNYADLPSTSGGTQGSAHMAAPIRLDLGQRGIREIRKNDAGDYLIIAGPPNGATGVAPRDFRLFSWDGRVNSGGQALNLRALDADVGSFTPPNTACSAEGIAALPTALALGGTATIVSDCGDANFYGDKTAAKDLPWAAWKKFRSDEVTIAALADMTVSSHADGITLQSAQAGVAHTVLLAKDAPEPSWEQVVRAKGAGDNAALWHQSASLLADTPLTLSPQGLVPGTEYVAYTVLIPEHGPASLVKLAAYNAPAVTGPEIDFPALPDRSLGSAPFPVSASAGTPGQAITINSLTGEVCQVNSAGNTPTVTLLAVGTCTLRAAQAAGASAPKVRDFEIRLPQTTGTALNGNDGSSASVTGTGWQFANNSMGGTSHASLPALPAGLRHVLPSGLHFILSGGAADVPAQVTLQWPQAAPERAALWKFGPTASQPEPHWYDAHAQLSPDRSSGTFTVSDGKDGDDDLRANGVIVDPVFLVAPAGAPLPVHATSVPTLSDWGRVWLALAMGVMAALAWSRRSKG